jgi:hypothetical protein
VPVIFTKWGIEWKVKGGKHKKRQDKIGYQIQWELFGRFDGLVGANKLLIYRSSIHGLSILYNFADAVSFSLQWRKMKDQPSRLARMCSAS